LLFIELLKELGVTETGPGGESLSIGDGRDIV
jgi:hypothetical protein